MRNWVIWIHLLHIFPAGLLLLLRLAYLSSHCSHQDCAASYVPAVFASYTDLVYIPGCLEGPDQGQSCAAADCELAYEPPLPQWGYLLGTTGTGTRGDLYNVMQHIYHSSWGVPVLCPPPWTVLPLSLFFSYLFLCSFILDSTTHNSLPYLSRLLFSLFPKHSWKICQTFFGANASLVAVFKFSVISFYGE